MLTGKATMTVEGCAIFEYELREAAPDNAPVLIIVDENDGSFECPHCRG